GDAEFAAVAREILFYLTREMTSEHGTFYAATDADSLAPGGSEEEGRFFTWTPEQLEAALGSDRARLFAARYGVTADGSLGGRSVLHLARPIDDVAREAGLEPEQVRSEIDGARELL